MNQFTETPRTANHPEILHPIAPQIEPVAQAMPMPEATARQLGRIGSESHLSFHSYEQPQMTPAKTREAAPSQVAHKRTATPHRPKNRRQTHTQPEKPKLPR